jgi:hypothetical protein
MRRIMDVRGDIDRNAPGFLDAPRPAPAITWISVGVGGPAAS